MATKTVRVITDTPVDRVCKGDCLSVSPEIADQFVKAGLVEIVPDAATQAVPKADK